MMVPEVESLTSALRKEMNSSAPHLHLYPHHVLVNNKADCILYSCFYNQSRRKTVFESALLYLEINSVSQTTRGGGVGQIQTRVIKKWYLSFILSNERKEEI